MIAARGDLSQGRNAKSLSSILRSSMLALLTGGTILAPLAAQAALFLYRPGPAVIVAPPPPAAAVIPAPHAGWVWTPGYWRWNGARYVWIEGIWVRARPGYRYVPAHWRPGRGGWIFVPGEWVRVP